MNTKEAYDRMAKCGVVVEGLRHGATGFYDYRNVDIGGTPAAVSRDHAAMLLEAAWHRKWPHLTCEHGLNNLWYVTQWDEGEYGRRDLTGGTTRLEAMVLYAEQAAKEDRTNG